MAAQFRRINALSRRLLRLWMAPANTSFPVPLFPVISTDERVRATMCRDSFRSRITRLSPTMVSKVLLGAEIWWSLFL